MVKDARKYVGDGNGQIFYQMIDCRKIPKDDQSFDKVIANHDIILFRRPAGSTERNQKSSKTRRNIYLQYLWKQSHAGDHTADQRF